MTDMRSEAMMDEQLDLITQYLNAQLDAKRAAEVRARLETDREFLKLAAPLLLAWDAMRNGRPARAGESEKRWDDFTRKADFEHHRKRRVRRNWWIMGILIAAIAIPGLWFRGEIRTQYRDWRDYQLVSGNMWVSLQQNIAAQVNAGALRSAKRVENNIQRVQLEGTAHFRVEPLDTVSFPPRTSPLVVQTPSAFIVAYIGDFTVSAMGDTTVVQTHEPVRRRRVGLMELQAMVMVGTDEHNQPLNVYEGQRVRVVRGSQPERLP